MSKQPKLICTDGNTARILRCTLRLNQSEFWGRLQVMQSAGSRYESGREMPEQVALLLHLIYGTEKQAAELLAFLRQ